MRLLLASLVLLVLAAPAQARGRCDSHSKGAEARTGKLIVFTTRDAEGVVRYYGCSRPGGPSLRFATEEPDDDIYGSDSTVRRLRVAGSYAGVEVTEGAAAYTVCTKYAGNPCRPPRTVWRVLDVRTRTLTEVPVLDRATAFALSPGGAIAWREPGDVLYATDLRSPTRVIDEGAIARLRFSGLTLSWTRDGAPRSVSLARP